MDRVRTTITLPADLHEALRLQAVRERKSLGNIIVERFKPHKRRQRKLTAEAQLKRDFALFDRAAASSVEYDAEKSVREERNRDDT